MKQTGFPERFKGVLFQEQFEKHSQSLLPTSQTSFAVCKPNLLIFREGPPAIHFEGGISVDQKGGFYDGIYNLPELTLFSFTHKQTHAHFNMESCTH